MSKYNLHVMKETYLQKLEPFWVPDTVLVSTGFNERLTMPKMVIVGGNDQFFPPDGSHYFFDELTPPKFMW